MALLAMGLFACAIFIAFNFVSRQYTAQAVFERHGDVISASTAKSLTASFSTLKPMLSYDLGGEPAVRQALIQIGYADHLPKDAAGKLTPDGAAELDRLVVRTTRDIRCSWLLKSINQDRVKLTLTGTDPVLAYSLTNQLVNNYIAQTRKKLLEQLADSEIFLTEQIALAKEKHEKLRETRFNFLKSNPNMLPDNPQFMSQQIEDLDVQTETLQHRREDLGRRLEALARELEQSSETVVPNADYIETANLKKGLERDLLSSRKLGMTEMHPKVLKLQRLIVDQQEKLDSMHTGTAVLADNPAAEARMEDITVSIERIDVELARKHTARQRYTKAQVNSLPIAMEYQRITDAIGVAEREAKMWDTNRATVQMALQAERNDKRTHFKFTNPASLTYRPSWPALWHVFALALAGGVVFGVILSILSDRLSRHFSSASEAKETLGLPMLGVIGPILTPAARRVLAIRRYVLLPAAVCLLVLIAAIAAAGVVMSTNYPGKYAQLMEQVSPTTRAAWYSVRSLLGLM